MLGAIEAGGSKFLCGVGTNPEDLQFIEIPTTTPDETLAAVTAYFKQCHVSRIGLACFGPIDVNRESPTFGYITNTPKLAWRNCDIVGWLEQTLQVPIGFHTDVNAAVLAEARWGAAQGLRDFVYFTVGTGIGGGALTNSCLLQGVSHPEMGHIPVRRHESDTFAGLCPSHGDCLEGLAAGPALKARWGTSSKEWSDDHPGWKLEAYYLAQAALSATLFLSPLAIIFGGGVIQHPHLMTLIEGEYTTLLGGYLTKQPKLLHAGLANPGLAGALLLAE